MICLVTGCAAVFTWLFQRKSINQSGVFTGMLPTLATTSTTFCKLVVYKVDYSSIQEKSISPYHKQFTVVTEWLNDAQSLF